jgi:uncharacterized protein (DUF433 family)
MLADGTTQQPRAPERALGVDRHVQWVRARPVTPAFGRFRGSPWRTTIAGMIEANPNVLSGKPVVAGTRITVELILEKLGAGESIEQIIEAHPRLIKQDVLDAISFAAKALRADVVYPVSGSAA